jgi:hypothetical protein
MDRKRIDFAVDVPWPNLSQAWAFARKWLLPNPGTLVLMIILALAIPALAAPRSAPEATSTSTISYQGRLADNAGNPLTGYYNLEFRIYDDPVVGTPLWEEFWTGGNSVQVSDGLFNVMLGSINNTLAAAIEGHDELYLGITVGTDSEMVPRVQLGSVPFAMYAAQANVSDGSITTAKIADGAVTTPKIADDAVNAGKIDGGSVWGASGKILLNFVPMPTQGDPVLNLNGVGNIGYTDLDLTGATSSSTVAVLLEVGFSDTQSESSDLKFLLRKNGETDRCAVVKATHRNGAANVAQVVCAVDGDQILEYQVNASGSNTAGATVWVLGYWEPAALP